MGAFWELSLIGWISGGVEDADELDSNMLRTES